MIKGSFLLESFITWIAMRFFGISVYKKFADSLQLQGGEQVLDFGCGFGTVAQYTAPLLPEGRLVCVDLSQRRLDKCRKNTKKNTNIEYLNVSIEKRYFPEETFDLIYCHFVLHEIDEIELESTLAEMYRWLKKKGKLVFREPAEDSQRLHHIDATLQEMGFIRDSTKILDIPIMGTAIESRYRKEEKKN